MLSSARQRPRASFKQSSSTRNLIIRTVVCNQRATSDRQAKVLILDDWLKSPRTKVVMNSVVFSTSVEGMNCFRALVRIESCGAGRTDEVDGFSLPKQLTARLSKSVRARRSH